MIAGARRRDCFYCYAEVVEFNPSRIPRSRVYGDGIPRGERTAVTKGLPGRLKNLPYIDAQVGEMKEEISEETTDKLARASERLWLDLERFAPRYSAQAI